MPSGVNTRNLSHGSLSLEDGQANVNTMAIAIDEGNLTFTEAREAAMVMQRHELDHWSRGPAQPVRVSFQIKFDAYKSRTTQAIVAADAGGAVTGFSVRDFLKNGGGLLTSVGGRTDVFTCTLIFTIANPMASGDENEVLRFTDFVTDQLTFSEGDEYNTVAVEGRANLESPASTRA